MPSHSCRILPCGHFQVGPLLSVRIHGNTFQEIGRQQKPQRDDPEGSRKSKWNSLQSGNYQGLITTGQFFGEGSDLKNASCLFLAYPISFKGKLIQYMGRVQRSELTPVIYDYRDGKID